MQLMFLYNSHSFILFACQAHDVVYIVFKSNYYDI